MRSCELPCLQGFSRPCKFTGGPFVPQGEGQCGLMSLIPEGRHWGTVVCGHRWGRRGSAFHIPDCLPCRGAGPPGSALVDRGTAVDRTAVVRPWPLYSQPWWEMCPGLCCLLGQFHLAVSAKERPRLPNHTARSVCTECHVLPSPHHRWHAGSSHCPVTAPAGVWLRVTFDAAAPALSALPEELCQPMTHIPAVFSRPLR